MILDTINELFSNNYFKIVLLLWMILVWLFIFRRQRRNKHHYNRIKSRAILEKIRSFSFDGQRLNYLRKIDPFVFEELLLDAFKANGFRVTRNKRYTGDQGIDGVVYKDGKKHLIQAKRYKGHINLRHLKEFAELVKARGCYGYFCHTGKTGKASKEAANASENIHVISGGNLITLLINRIGKMEMKQNIMLDPNENQEFLERLKSDINNPEIHDLRRKKASEILRENGQNF